MLFHLYFKCLWYKEKALTAILTKKNINDLVQISKTKENI